MLYRDSRTERALVWIFGSPRSGSTWLLNLLVNAPPVVKIDELGIGSHLGVFTSDVLGTPAPDSNSSQELFFRARRESNDYFFSDRYADTWRPALRTLILSRIRAQILDGKPSVPLRERVAVVKEPNGTQAAEILLGTLPGSRVLALVRDGRDVVDSMVDAMLPDSWLSTTLAGGRSLSEDDRMEFIGLQARRWVARTSLLLDAYNRHDPSRRMLVRYEELLTDTTRGLQAIFDWLGVSTSGAEVEMIVQKMAYENLPPDQTGKGRFVRTAKPGSWRENLNTVEQGALTGIMAETLRAVGYEP